jgi:hypothetical protein
LDAEGGSFNFVVGVVDDSHGVFSSLHQSVWPILVKLLFTPEEFWLSADGNI